MLEITTDIKQAFFDRGKIIDAVERNTRMALSKAGAYILTRQRSSIRRRKGVSLPGQPPSARSTDPYATPKNILFGYDARTLSVAVGMVRINGTPTYPASPGVFEKGGTVTIRQRRKNRGGTTRKRMRIRKRPSAVPALQKEIALGNVIGPWAGVVTP